MCVHDDCLAATTGRSYDRSPDSESLLRFHQAIADGWHSEVANGGGEHAGELPLAVMPPGRHYAERRHRDTCANPSGKI